MKKTKEILREVNDELGDLTIQILKSSKRTVKNGLSSGSFVLNDALSGNPLIGYAWGRIVEIYGVEQSGKTTLALHALREAQKVSVPCLFVDAEHALDPVYAESIGVDLADVLICQPDFGEQAIEVVRSAVKAGTRLVVVDSVAALTPRAEIEGDTGDAHMGSQARLMGKAMRQLVSIVSKNEAIVIFINQIRMKIGIVFGSNETTSGGKALKFYASYRLEVRSPRGGAEKKKSLDGDTVETGIASNVKVVKNKLFPPFRTAKLYIEYGKGVNRYRDVAAFLLKQDDGHAQLGSKTYTKKSLVTALQRSSSLRKLAHSEIDRISKQDAST